MIWRLPVKLIVASYMAQISAAMWITAVKGEAREEV